MNNWSNWSPKETFKCLMNRFIQSTAVDLALENFGKLANRINKDTKIKPLIKPLYVQHDAFILDVDKRAIEWLLDAIKDMERTSVGWFPCSVSNFISSKPFSK